MRCESKSAPRNSPEPFKPLEPRIPPRPVNPLRPLRQSPPEFRGYRGGGSGVPLDHAFQEYSPPMPD